MAKEFRPYLKRTLGQVSNPSLRHVIGDSKIETYRSVLGSLERLTTVHPINSDTVIDSSKANSLGYGDIKVATDGSETLYERIADARAFVAAIESEKEAFRPSEPAWYASLNEGDLEDYAFVIPKLPESFIALKHKSFSTHKAVVEDRTDHGLIRQWHRAGERIMQLGGEPVMAPVEGQFYGSAYSCDPAELASFTEKNMRIGERPLCFFRPKKGELKSILWSAVYEDQAVVRAYAGGKKLPSGISARPELFRKQLEEQFKAFSGNHLQTFPVSDLPVLDSGLSAESFA